MVEVCLDGVFGREYRKLMSVISPGFGGWETPGGGRKATGEGSQNRGEERIGTYREASSSKRVAPVRVVTETLLRRRGWHLFLGCTCSAAPDSGTCSTQDLVEEGGTCSLVRDVMFPRGSFPPALPFVSGG
jgi:hypothetical protein